MSNNCKVSFIVVNWNGRHLLRDCLESIFKQSYKNYDVIVVDNASDDGSVEWICRSYPLAQVVELSANFGFAGGNNRGLIECHGEYIALVNNDVVLDENWLENIIVPLEEEPSVGFVSSRIFVRGSVSIDSIGDRITSAFTGVKLAEGRDGNLYDFPVHVQGVCAAACIYRRSMLDEIGFFDEDLFLNYEDTDLNIRSWLRGWMCRYAPGAIAHHAVNSTIGKMSSLSVFYFSRNSLLVLIKNIPLRLIVRRIPQRVIYELATFFYYAILQKRFLSYVRGKLSAFGMLPYMLRKRKTLLGEIKLSDEEIMGCQVPIIKIIRDQFFKIFL